MLLGGAGTVLGPLVGTALMFYLVDLGSSATTSHLLVVGVALLALVLFAPQGLLGALRARAAAVAAVTLLEARGLSRRFGGLHAVDAVDLDLAAQRVHALIGPNGAGKTTRQPALPAACCPTPARSASTAATSPACPRTPASRLGIAYTFQITSIYPRLSVFDNVALAAQRQAADLARRALRRAGPRRPRRPRRPPPAPSPTATSACSRSPWAWRCARAPDPRRADPGPRARRDRRLQGAGARRSPATRRCC